MKNNRVVSILVPVILIVCIVMVTLWLRVVLPYDKVFAGDWVKHTGIDAYYYMRLVDNIVRNFPQLTAFDPYMQYPSGAVTGTSPDFFAYFMGAIIWLVSLGHANQHTVDVIAVYIPPVLAVLTILAVYFIGKAIGGKWLGLMSAGLLAIMPGEFLNRSLLGYTDHHIAEVLFSTAAMLFVLLGVKAGEGKKLGEMVKERWQGIGKVVLYGVLGGISIGLYMLTWQGALLFVLILFVYIVVQSVIDHLRGRLVDYLGVLGAVAFLTAILIYGPFGNTISVLSLLIGFVGSIGLAFVSSLLIKRNVNKYYYPVIITVVGLMSILALYLLSPGTLDTMAGYLKAMLFTWQTDTTVMEMQPLLIYQGAFTMAVALGNFMLAFFFSLLAIGLLVYVVIKKGEADKTFLLIWSLIILMVALGMKRFAYYYAVDVALLTGYICWIVLNILLTRQKNIEIKKEKNAAAATKRKGKSASEGVRRIRSYQASILLVILAIILLVYYPNLGPLPDGEKPAIDLASSPLFAPPDAWCESLEWLQRNSEIPLRDEDAYYALYQPPNSTGGFEYPASAYSVISWWDYGYWITRISHRMPVSNPGSGHRGEASFFTAQDEIIAARAANNSGFHYVIVDNEIAAYDSKFFALANLSGGAYTDYYDVYLQRQDNRYLPVILFYPEYYRTMVVRLYNFGGKEVIPVAVDVIRTNLVSMSDGKQYKEIVERKRFDTYQEAQQFIVDNPDKKYFIVGSDPLKSPVPLEKLQNYELVYSSSQHVTFGNSSQPKIKIFKYRRDAIPVSGDWLGEGKSKAGLWQPEKGMLLYSNEGQKTEVGNFGYSTDVPVAGDWNGDGKSKIGVWRPSDLCYYLDNNGNGIWDPENGDKKLGPFGLYFTQTPITGDWNGDGLSRVGYWGYENISNGFYFFLDINGTGIWENSDFKLGPFGKAGDIPVTGDWNGDKKTEIGVWEPETGYFLLDYSGDGLFDISKGDLKIGPYGESYCTPIAGDWNGQGKDSVGVWDPKTRLFHLNINRDGQWDNSSSNIVIDMTDKK